MARIVRGAEAQEVRVMVEVTSTGPRIMVGRGFDATLLREVVVALEGGR